MKKTTLLLSILFLSAQVFAASEAFELNNLTTTQWKQRVSERPIKKIIVRMRRGSGNEKTYVNLRFGRESVTLDGAKRVYFPHDDWIKVEWNVNGASPGNKDLILNAYKGSVVLDYVQVVWP